MGVFDRFKKKPEQKRMFSAGKVDRLTASWTATPQTPDQVVEGNLTALVARSREQYANNDYARRFVELVQSNVVGPHGVIMQSRAANPRGGLDKLANGALEDAWTKWGRRGTCDVTGTLSWKQAQVMFIRTVVVDGECFIRKVKTKQGLKLQFIDPQLIDVGYKHDKLKGGRYIRAGIEFDQWGSPVAYHVKTDTGADTYSIGGMSYTRVDAKHMIHGFLPERIGQKRGLPWMATALARMKQLNAYEEAAVVAARVGASKLGFFKSADGEAFQGSEYSSDGEIITDAEPGTFHQLPAGVDFTAFDPGYPTGEFNGFVKSCLRGISSGLGVSYNTLANDLEGVNFSSIRAGVLEDRESWKMLQEFLIDTLCRPLFEEWLTLSLLTGTIKVQGGSLGIGRADKFKDAIWQPRRWSWVDPVKDIQAAKEAIRLGLRSRSDVIREMGKDPGDVWAEIQAERELMQTLDVPIDNSTQMSTAETVSTSVAVEAEEGETPDAPQTED